MSERGDGLIAEAEARASLWVHAVCIHGIFPRADDGVRAYRQGFLDAYSEVSRLRAELQAAHLGLIEAGARDAALGAGRSLLEKLNAERAEVSRLREELREHSELYALVAKQNDNLREENERAKAESVTFRAILGGHGTQWAVVSSDHDLIPCANGEGEARRTLEDWPGAVLIVYREVR